MVVRLPEMKKYLNRDGLEEYNSLLPHSSTEIEEYVADWLDAHPEATTTVQDGSITTQKLADASVTRNKLAADVAHLLGGMMLTKEVQGEILSAQDAYSVAPLSMTIDGKSTQDGTPTPDNPVPIDSIEVLELPVTFAGKNLLNPATLRNGYITDDGSVYGSSAKFKHNEYLPVIPNMTYRVSQGNAGFNSAIRTAFYDSNKTFIVAYSQNGYLAPTFKAPANAAFMRSSFNGPQAAYAMIELDTGSFAGFVPYVGITANIPMQGHVLRSLPDGTCDTLSLTYLRPSTREGWAWYGAELVHRVSETTVGACSWTAYYTKNFYSSLNGNCRVARTGLSEYLCNVLVPATTTSLADSSSNPDNSIFGGANEGNVIIRTASSYESASAFKTAYADAVIQYPLATPITTQLDPIELPVLPAPNCTVWSDPATGLKMSYMRDSNIVISDIEQAIADQ